MSHRSGTTPGILLLIIGLTALLYLINLSAEVPSLPGGLP